MKTAVLCIGDELLKGATVNTNLAHIGQKLLEIGIVPVFAAEIPDAREPICKALAQALEHADLVLTTGGLGPTADDVTKEYIAAELGLRLEEDSDTTVRILQYWKMRHASEQMPHRVLNQALVPHGAEVIPNEFGTAPGLILRTSDASRFPGKTVILLPGPPSEMEPMFDARILPFIREQRKEVLHTRLFLLMGIGEPQTEERMLEVLSRHHPLSAAYCAEPGLVRLFLTSTDPYTVAAAEEDVKRIFAENILDGESRSPAHEIIRLLRREKAVMAAAESCTGGLVSKLMTDVPGASDVFLGSVVSYDNRIKTGLLGVPEETLREHGAVSPETARAMVEGAAARFGADAAVSLTGIAGPGGGTPEKPVGLVYAGIFWRGETEVHELRLRRSREQIRAGAAAAALNLLRRKILAL